MKIEDVIAKFDMGAGVFSREEMEVALDAYLEAMAGESAAYDALMRSEGLDR